MNTSRKEEEQEETLPFLPRLQVFRRIDEQIRFQEVMMLSSEIRLAMSLSLRHWLRLMVSCSLWCSHGARMSSWPSRSGEAWRAFSLQQRAVVLCRSLFSLGVSDDRFLFVAMFCLLR